MDQQGDRRGQSELLGMAILFGIVITVSLAIVIAGGALLEQSRTSTVMASAEQSMTQFDGTVSGLGTGSEDTGTISFAQLRTRGELTIRESGSMRVVVKEQNGTTETLNRSLAMGALVFQRGDKEIAYQGGGVFRRDAGTDESVMISPPRFDYRYRQGDPTLTLPLVRLNGTLGSGEVSVRQSGATENVFPDGSTVNPLDDDEAVVLTVQSEYYRSWGRLFLARTDGQVSFDHETDSVTLTLKGLTRTTTTNGTYVPGAIYSGASTLRFHNRASTGSYDDPSDLSSPPGSLGNEGDVYVDGLFHPTKEEVRIGGDLVATGNAIMQSQDTSTPQVVEGNVTVGASPSEATILVGQVEVGKTLSTQGDLKLNNASGADETILVREDVLVGNDLIFAKQTRIEGDVHVDGAVNQLGPHVTIEGDLYIDEDLESVNDNVTVMGSVYVGESLDPDGDGLGRNFTVGEDLVVRQEFNHDVDTGGGPPAGFGGGPGSLRTTVDGSVYVRGDVVSFEHIAVNEDLHVHGDLNDYGPQAHVDGEIQVDGEDNTGGFFGIGGAPVDGDDPAAVPSFTVTTARAPAIPGLDPVNDRIAAKGDAFDDGNNDNGDATTTIEKFRNTTPGACDPCELDSGRYYLPGGLELDNERLVLDTSDGPIEIYAGQAAGSGMGLYLNDARIEIQGDNQVSVYTPGNFEMLEGGGSIETAVTTSPESYRAEQFFLYMRDDREARFNSGGMEFTGVVYGPGDGGGVDFTVTNDALIHGGLVGDVERVNEDARIYFDERLGGADSRQSVSAPATSEDVRFVQISRANVTLDA